MRQPRHAEQTPPHYAYLLFAQECLSLLDTLPLEDQELVLMLLTLKVAHWQKKRGLRIRMLGKEA